MNEHTIEHLAELGNRDFFLICARCSRTSGRNNVLDATNLRRWQSAATKATG